MYYPKTTTDARWREWSEHLQTDTVTADHLNTTIRNTIQTLGGVKTMPAESTEEKRPVVTLEVDEIDNGYLVCMRTGLGRQPSRLFVASLDELPGLLAGQFAADKIEG